MTGTLLAELILDGSAALDAALAFDTLVRIGQDTADGVAALVPMATSVVEKSWSRSARSLARCAGQDVSISATLWGS